MESKGKNTSLSEFQRAFAYDSYLPTNLLLLFNPGVSNASHSVGQNDLLDGPWWFIWGSLFTILIPIYPFVYYSDHVNLNHFQFLSLIADFYFLLDHVSP